MATVTLPAPGSQARFDGAAGVNPEEAVAALPKAAAGLLDAMKRSGWRWSVGWSEDTAGHLFVTIRGGIRPEAQVDATWHTRGTGTLRLFGLLLRSGPVHSITRRGWHDASLRAAVTVIEENRAP